MKKQNQKKKRNAIKDLYLDRPTSHGGWPDGHQGGYTDTKKPVNKQISDYLKAMGLVDDSNPRARLSEEKIRFLVRNVIQESYRYMQGNIGDYYVSVSDPGDIVQIVDYFDIPPEDDRGEIVYYLYRNPNGDVRRMKVRHFHSRYKRID